VKQRQKQRLGNLEKELLKQEEIGLPKDKVEFFAEVLGIKPYHIASSRSNLKHMKTLSAEDPEKTREILCSVGYHKRLQSSRSIDRWRKALEVSREGLNVLRDQGCSKLIFIGKARIIEKRADGDKVYKFTFHNTVTEET